MSSRRRTPVGRPRTLRGRLVALLVVILTVGFVAAALVTVLVVRRVLVDRLDAQLRAAGDRFAVSLEYNDGDADNAGGGYGSVEGQPAGTLGARVLNGVVTNSAIVGSHDGADTDTLSAAAKSRLAALAVDATPRSVVLPGVGEYRVIVAAGRDGDRQITGLPADPVETTIDKVVVLEIVVFGVTLLLVAAASTGLVQVMLRPLSRMAGTAADVSALSLGSGRVTLPQRERTGSRGSEVDALGRAFDTMLEQVQSALHTRDDSEDRLRRFVADASHELRTPVAVVRSHAELALRSDAVALPQDVVHSLERITAQAQRMGQLVDDLLLLARLDSGVEPVHDDVDVTRVALEAVEDVRATTADHRWRLELPSDSVWTRGDGHALSRAVVNLLANATVHTPTGTTVTVAVNVDADADAVHLTVTDDGPGMSDELAAHAFDRFVRGEQTRRPEHGSSGLGLSIVAAIVAAHHGTVSMDSGHTGTCVRLTLPERGSTMPDETSRLTSSHVPARSLSSAGRDRRLQLDANLNRT